MTVRCPRCDTAYRMPPRSCLGAHPMFRCSRCEHVFDPEETLEEPELIDDGLDPPETDHTEPADEDGEAPGPTMTTARFAVRSAVGVILAFALLSISSTPIAGASPTWCRACRWSGATSPAHRSIPETSS